VSMPAAVQRIRELSCAASRHHREPLRHRPKPDSLRHLLRTMTRDIGNSDERRLLK
jgi:hypothetical protein